MEKKITVIDDKLTIEETDDYVKYYTDDVVITEFKKTMKPRIKINSRDKYYVKLESMGMLPNGKTELCRYYVPKLLSNEFADVPHTLQAFYDKVKRYWDRKSSHIIYK